MHEILRKLQRELADGLSGLSAEQTQLKRASGTWSIQQIAEHLLLTYESTAAVFEGRLLKGTPTLSRPTLQQRVGQFVLTTLGVFPKGRLSPEIVSPAEPSVRLLSASDLNERAIEVLFPMDALLTEAERMFGERPRSVSHAVLGPMRPQQWRRFHFVHGEHHLRQILATRRVWQI